MEKGYKTRTKNTHIIYKYGMGRFTFSIHKTCMDTRNCKCSKVDAAGALLFPATEHAWTEETANVQKWMQPFMLCDKLCQHSQTLKTLVIIISFQILH